MKFIGLIKLSALTTARSQPQKSVTVVIWLVLNDSSPREWAYRTVQLQYEIMK